MASITTEDYLKIIYNETKEFGRAVTTSRLAERLEISNAAISDMAKKLAQQGYVSYKKYKGMELTKKGEKIALNVIRRHRLWEAFLLKSLGISLSEVHNIAENLEHHSPDILIEKIDEYLEYPSFDPHGHPIPKHNGEMPVRNGAVSLNKADIGSRYKVAMIDDANKELMIFFNKIGIILHKIIKVKGKLSFDNSVIVEVDKKDFTLSEKMTENLFVVKEI